MCRALKINLVYRSIAFLMIPTPAFAAQPSSLGQWQLLSLFEKGGAMMYPILFSSVLMLGIAIERGYSLRRTNIINPDFVKDVRSQWDWQNIQKTLRLCNSYDNSLSRILKMGLLRFGGKLDEIERAIEAGGQHEASLMNSNLRVLGAVANITPKGQPLVLQPVSLTYSRLDGVPIGRHLRPLFAWYGDVDMFSHASRLIGLGRLTVTVSFHEPITIEEFSSRKELATYCFNKISHGHAEALAGRLQPLAGKAGRWDWISWRPRPRLRDIRSRRRAPGIKAGIEGRRRLDSR